jgi:hypothetical protein
VELRSTDPQPLRPGPGDDGPGEAAGGYALERISSAASRQSRQPQRNPDKPIKTAGGDSAPGERARRPAVVVDGLLAPPERIDTGLWSAVLYPLRSAEALAFVAVMACVFWVLSVLLPEYCLTVWADSETLGTPSMGMLVILISVIPGLILLPLVLVYCLQYLGRILVSSAKGDVLPPRTPDRNFEGLTAGLSPWLVWLVLGLSVSCLPCASYWLSAGEPSGHSIVTTVFLILIGLPYAAISLMLSFLHDRRLAATPTGVLRTLGRHAGSFSPTFLKAAVVLGLASLAVALTLRLRDVAFWVYVPAALACWGLLLWAALVVLRMLGLHVFQHRESLGWHRQSRWGVSWRL